MIAVIDGIGSNINSILFSLQRLKVDAILTNNIPIINAATHVILPGVGHAGFGMQQLEQQNLIDTIKQLKQPVLGICLGMHLLYAHSEEGDTPCLGIIPQNIKKLPVTLPQITIPHMGWNQLHWNHSTHHLRMEINATDRVYFVHSYAAPVSNFTIASTQHGNFFSAIVQYKNFYAMQFHPEKSGDVGEKLLYNFLIN